jgi:hypothetical protein
VKITKIGTDYISINEDTIHYEEYLNISKVHLIKLSFDTPTKSKIEQVLSLFPRTNRYVIEDNIREYNFILRRTSKKYYVENYSGVGVISFFRKNNKVLLNFHKLTQDEKEFIVHNCFEDVLKNLEVIHIDEHIYDLKEDVLIKWNGNVVISEHNDI